SGLSSLDGTGASASAPSLGSRLRTACARRGTGRPEPDSPRGPRQACRFAELCPHRVLPGVARGREGRDRAPARAAALAGDACPVARGRGPDASGRTGVPAAPALPALRAAVARVLCADLGDLPPAGRRREPRGRALAAARTLAPFFRAARLRGDQRH